MNSLNSHKEKIATSNSQHANGKKKYLKRSSSIAPIVRFLFGIWVIKMNWMNWEPNKERYCNANCISFLYEMHQQYEQRFSTWLNYAQRADSKGFHWGRRQYNSQQINLIFSNQAFNFVDRDGFQCPLCLTFVYWLFYNSRKKWN